MLIVVLEGGGKFIFFDILDFCGLEISFPFVLMCISCFCIGFLMTMASQRVDTEHIKLDRPVLKECHSSFDSSLRYVSVMFFAQIIVLPVLCNKPIVYSGFSRLYCNYRMGYG